MPGERHDGLLKPLGAAGRHSRHGLPVSRTGGTTLLDLIDRRTRSDPEVAADGMRWLAGINPAAAAEARRVLDEAAEHFDHDALAVIALLDDVGVRARRGQALRLT